MTDEQHELCYSIQLAIVKVIINLDHEKIWKIIEKEIKKSEEGKRKV